MNKDQAVSAFWKTFGIDSYDESNVPTDATYPYLTHEEAVDTLGYPIAQTASLYYRSSSWSDVIAKRDEIAEYISKGGRLVKYDNGAFWIRMGRPWAQRMADSSDDMVRRMLLNYVIEFIE